MIGKTLVKKTASRRSTRKTRSLAVIVHPAEDGGFWATCPSIPGCFSQGDTMDDVLRNIREAIAVSLDSLPKRQQATIPLDESVHLVRV